MKLRCWFTWICTLGLLLGCVSRTFAAGPVLPEELFFLPQPSSHHPAIYGVDVLIDVGHGGIDSGTVHGTIEEKNINLAIAKKTYDELKRKGFNVMLNRMDDYALSSENEWLRIRSRHKKDLAQRSHLANEVKPRMMLSLHVNSSRSSGTRGPLMLYQKNEKSKQLATLLQQAMNPLYGVTEKPRYGKTYYVLRHTKVPTVIVEMGYLTNPQDREMLTQDKGQHLIAKHIGTGVETFLNLQ